MSFDLGKKSLDLVGYEWNEAVRAAEKEGKILKKSVTKFKAGSENNTVRIIKQLHQDDDVIECICVYEAWDILNTRTKE